MKGFVCDHCGKVESGLPSDRLEGDVILKDLKQFVYLKIELVGSLPSPDLCNECKLHFAEMVIETAKALVIGYSL